MKLLIENWRKYNNEPFALMCEQHQKSLITEQELFARWEAMVLLEIEKLEEIDWEKEAELTADPDYKPPQERAGMLARGWQRINDWILEKSVQLIELAKTSAQKALSSIRWLVDKIQDFCAEYSLVCKIAKWTLAVVAIYILAAFVFENEAEAKLYRSGQPLPDTIVNAMKGEMVDIIDRTKSPDKSHYYKILAQIDELHNSKTPHDFMKSKGQVDEGLKILYDGLKDVYNAESGTGVNPEEGKELVRRWVDIGERTVAWYREVVSKIEGPGVSGKSVVYDYGKKLMKPQ